MPTNPGQMENLEGSSAEWGLPMGAIYPRWLRVRWEQALRRRDGWRDRLVLLRQHLRWHNEQYGNVATARIPRSVSENTLREHGLIVERVLGAGRIVSAAPWRPQWLPEASGLDPAAPADAARPRQRTSLECDGDPALRRIGFHSYRSEGQRAALRSVLTAPAGSTLLILLPTGGGKSLCATLPAALDPDGLTVVIVPTVALALDQQRALEDMSVERPSEVWGPAPYAYQGASTGEIRRANETIRERVQTGQQRIVFASPEAALTSLAPALRNSARSGLLRRLVIDEAHLVDQWGEGFRPSFQDLTGFRRALLAITPREPFRTVLLSATVTNAVRETLQVSFGDPGPFATVAAPQIRPEPAYWSIHCEGEAQRWAFIVEALHHLPRPLILYTTRPNDAAEWHRSLRNAGYARIATMSGETRASDRDRVIQGWRDREFDLVVGTSAFGMGVDLPEVRSVVHACYPESLDRYYQEVGRGGRDGLACVALLAYTDRDQRMADQLSRRTYVSVDVGLARWRRMFEYKRVLAETEVGVSLEVGREVDMASAKNVYWNLRTLTLMCRAGLVELRGLRTDERVEVPEGEEPRAEELRFERARRVVRIVEPRHLDAAVWEERIEPLRRTMAEEAVVSFRAMRAVERPDKCLGQQLSGYYALEGEPSPAVACGGCAACRIANCAAYVAMPPAGAVPWALLLADLAAKSPPPWLSAASVVAVTFEPDDPTLLRERLLEAIRGLARYGVRQVVHPAGWEGDLERVQRTVPPLFFVSRYAPLEMLEAPTVVVTMHGMVPTAALAGPPQPRVLIFPMDAPDPEAPHRQLRYRFPNSMSLPYLMDKLGG